MNRFDIINRIGDKYRVGNTETGEFSYAQALKTVGKDIKDYQKATTGTQHKFLDIRFENERLVVLVECKNKFSRWDKAKIQGQLQDYVRFEKAYSDKKIVAILAETDGDEVWVWFGQSVIIDDEHRMEEETVLRTFEEYENLCFGRVNDKIKVVDSIKTLNEKLHSDGINEKLRSQFVGTCLLALKNGLVYKNVKETLDPKTGKKLAPERVVLKSIKDILEGLLTRGGSLNKAGKLAVLNSKVLDDQDVTSLTYKELEDILQFIDDNVVPYINDKSTAGQDLLNLFFTTFNKYVGKSDKNQAFTPDHICDFMSKAVGVNKNSRVLDPCCGSGAFLVRAMTDAMDDCDTEEEREEVKKNQIFGIEYEEGAFGLSSTNMLIHGDGNSNVVQDSMFKRAKWIAENNINIVLMNPPYNATKKCCDPDYTKGWDAKKKEDPSKGLHFVEWVARHVPSTCKMAVLLPMQAAIGNSGDVKTFKKKMLDNYTLDAVFSLPTEMFYPGAAAVACCMIFDLSQKHEKANKETFFGYYKDDKFIKRKGLGRVERTDADGNSLWNKTEEIWLNLYKNKKVVPGLSVMHRVSWKDEWLAEAYMETDYSTLAAEDFQKTINDYLSEALSTSNMQLLFDTLGIRRYPITKKSEKMKWKEFEARLKKARDGKAIDVINTIVETKLVPVPSLVDGYYHLYFDAPDTIYGLDATIRDVLDLDYSQFRAAIEFLYPEAEFSTEHGVKGEEYDNVVFVISKGWNQYQFETYAPMITGRTPIPNGKQTSYERNRNLFYVCCSRPRKRLFFFVSVPIDASFRVFLDDLVGAENIYTYGQYLEAKQ